MTLRPSSMSMGDRDLSRWSLDPLIPGGTYLSGDLGARGWWYSLYALGGRSHGEGGERSRSLTLGCCRMVRFRTTGST